VKEKRCLVKGRLFRKIIAISIILVQGVSQTLCMLCFVVFNTKLNKKTVKNRNCAFQEFGRQLLTSTTRRYKTCAIPICLLHREAERKIKGR
jgi:hypothetical protein